MYSTFFVSKTDCMTCTNKALKSLGTLQGVFGVEINQIDGIIEVNHTDEVTRNEIADMLLTLGYPEFENKEQANQKIVDYDEPSIWGCAL